MITPYFEQVLVPARNVSLCELLETFLKSGFVRDQRDINNTKKAFALLFECLPEIETANFGAKSLRIYQDFLIAKGYAREYVNKLVKFLKSVIRWAVSYELISANVLAALQSVASVKPGRAKDNPERDAVDDSIVETTLPYLPQVLQNMTRFQRVTGMRPSEVCRMRIGFIKPFMRCDQSYMCCEFQEHKTAWFGSIKYVPLDETAMNILKPYALSGNFPPEQFVFRTPYKKVQWKVAHWDRVLKEAIEKHGLPKWTLYQLRHTKGTELVIKEDIEVAAAVLGNSIEVMNRVYNHSRFEKMFRSIESATPSPVILKIYRED